MQNNNQQVPLSPEQKQQSQNLDVQVQQFEEQLQQKSNSDLKQIADQLDIVEREMLLGKIDNQLKTIKEAIVKPGDAASTAATGSAAATAVAIQSSSTVDAP